LVSFAIIPKYLAENVQNEFDDVQIFQTPLNTASCLGFGVVGFRTLTNA
jgi:hypothetical protein